MSFLYGSLHSPAREGRAVFSDLMAVKGHSRARESGNYENREVDAKKEFRFGVIATSPLVRAYETADSIAALWPERTGNCLENWDPG